MLAVGLMVSGVGAQADVISREVTVKVLPNAPVDVISRQVTVKVLPAAPVDVISREVSVDVPFPDLVSSVQSYPTAPRAASYIDLSYMVSNSQGTAHAPWTDIIGISSDQVLGNADDINLASFVRSSDLDVGGSYANGTTVWLPPTISGTYWVFVQTDVGGVVEENGATANNLAFSASPISIQAFTGDVLTAGAHISTVDSSRDGMDLVIESGPVNIDGAHTFASLTIHQGGELSHTAGLGGGMDLVVTGDVLITADSSINVSGKGYSPGQGPGAYGADAGASHGGLGGMVPVGQDLSYGAIQGPRTLGSGGGGGAATSGGGAVRLVVGGELSLDGDIRAHGLPMSGGYAFHGGGSAGSIWVAAGVVSGSGGIRAEGGRGLTSWPNSSGGGGGGRVHLESGSVSGFTGPIVAFGGVGRTHGGAGSVLVEDLSAGSSDLFVLNFQSGLNIANNPLNWGATVLPSELPYDSVVIDNGVRLEVDRPSFGLRLVAGGDLYLGSGAAIWGEAIGFTLREGPGAGTDYWDGAGHGGVGGHFGGASNDNLILPLLPGSGADNHPGAQGGGAVALDVAGDLVFNGLINVNAFHSHGGAGGSALLLADSISGVGVITAKGGEGNGTLICQSTWGSGGGGRVALHARDPQGLSGYAGTIDVAGGTYIPCGGGPAGGGTLHQQESSTAVLPPIPLIDGFEDFDLLPVASAPDRVPSGFSGSWGNAGAWGFPPTYDTFAGGDTTNFGLRVVDSTNFDPSITKLGNSLALRETPAGIGLPFPDLFVAGLWKHEAHRQDGPAVRVETSVWVGSGVGGGGILSVGNGNGQMATSNLAPINDMGPTIEWLSDGRLVAHLAGMGATQDIDLPTSSAPLYLFDEWQRVRLDIHLGTDTYDLWWAPVGQSFSLVAQALPFVTNQRRLDRFVVGQQQHAKALYDDFTVKFDYGQANASSIPTGCIGPAGPMLLTSSRPVLGTTLHSDVTGFGPTSLAIAVVGYTSQSIPLSAIIPVGLVGCNLLATTDSMVLSLPVVGASSYQLTIPASPSLVGFELYHQFLQLELDGTGAMVSLSSSNGLRLILGF